MKLEDVRIAVVGLGYVGLPLAVEFGKHFPVLGYDINPIRIAELQRRLDKTMEVDLTELKAAKHLSYTTDDSELASANVYIVTTPTPIDEFKRPDLRPLLGASQTIAKHLAPGDVVIYESTVYPGATEEECVPILSDVSGLVYNTDFFVGYSPERINPGDKTHRVTNIVKVTSGSTPEAAALIDALYRVIVAVGTHPAPSIRVAEAAKVIENTQRDVNIALMNELAVLFSTLDIDTEDVLLAAGSKWNFLPFRPGLVGGHCIGVDPYYLTHKAQAVGHNPELILAGRRMNDSMGTYVASQLIKALARAGAPVHGSRVLVLGLTFKEDTPDLRNTRVIDVIRELEAYGVEIDVHDPWADPQESLSLYGITMVDEPTQETYDAILIAVRHRQFREAGQTIREYGKTSGCVLYDLKQTIEPMTTDIRL